VLGTQPDGKGDRRDDQSRSTEGAQEPSPHGRRHRVAHQSVDTRRTQNREGQGEEHDVAVPGDPADHRGTLHHGIERALEREQDGHHRHRAQSQDLSPAPPDPQPHHGQDRRDHADIRRRHAEVDALQPDEKVRDVGQRVGGRSGGGGSTRSLHHLQAGQEQRRAETESARGRDGEIDHGAAKYDPRRSSQHGQVDGEEDHHRNTQHREAFGMAAIDRQRHGDGQGDAVSESVAPAHEENGSSEDPTGPTRHARHRPSGVVEHRTGQLEDGATEGGAQRAHSEDAAQRVHPGAGDEELRQHDHRVRIVQRCEVAQEHGHTEDAGLPTEGQWRAQHVVGVPQWQLAVVDLVPRGVGQREEIEHLVGGKLAVDCDAGVLGETDPRQQVERSERHSEP